MEAQPQESAATTSTAPNEVRKQLLNDVKKQIEYYLSDANLKHDEFFYKTIKESQVGAIPIEALLKCNKVKQLNVTKDDILEAVGNSEEVETTGDGDAVKRKNDRPLPEFEPKVAKKVKTDKKPKQGDDNTKTFEPKVYKLTLAKEDPNLKWNDVQAEIEKQFGKINYTRLNGTEGHIAVNVNGTSIDTLQKLGNATVKVGENEVKIEDCFGDDLKKFTEEHGKHLDFCLERAGLKKKARTGKKDWNSKDKKGGDKKENGEAAQ